MKTIVLASFNKGKVREYEEMLSPLGYQVPSCRDFPQFEEPEENGENYEENAFIKAIALRRFTSAPILADDSGIEIMALKGFPGLFSSRFAKSCGGNQNAWQEIIGRLQGQDRAARFVCHICYLPENSSKAHYFEGICPGYILDEPHGDNGFGYDPIFHSDEADIDFGVAPEEIKNAYSHRGKALRSLCEYLANEGK